MASGYGYTGGRSRCFALWQEFSKCYAQTDQPIECGHAAQDYLECLHHTQEIARAKAIKAQFVKRAEHESTESRKAADVLADGVIVGVGLISRKKGESGESGENGGEKQG